MCSQIHRVKNKLKGMTTNIISHVTAWLQAHWAIRIMDEPCVYSHTDWTLDLCCKHYNTNVQRHFVFIQHRNTT